LYSSLSFYQVTDNTQQNNKVHFISKFFFQLFTSFFVNKINPVILLIIIFWYLNISYLSKSLNWYCMEMN